MSRDILWSDDKSPVSLDEFTVVSQTLVDLFSPENSSLTRNFTSTKRVLLRYYSLLQYTHLSHSTLSSIPLPRSLDPSSSVPLPSRLYTLLILIRDTTTALVNLPFFLLPLLFHLPVYFISRYGAHLVRDEEETQAQNKLRLWVTLPPLPLPNPLHLSMGPLPFHFRRNCGGVSRGVHPLDASHQNGG